MAQDLKTSSLPALVQLYELDATHLGLSSILYFTNFVEGGQLKYTFNGNDYNALPIEAKGFEASNTLPRPKLIVSSMAGVVASNVVKHNNLLGAVITRHSVLFGKTVAYKTEKYKIQQKTKHNRTVIEFELSSFLDYNNAQIPKRKAICNYCTFDYRAWNPTTSTFKLNSCPYSGANYFDSEGNATTDPAKDICGKKLKDCKLRFGEDSLGGNFFSGMRNI